MKLNEVINFLNLNLYTIVDILIITFILYKLYLILSKTRALQILLGIILILIFDLLSTKFRLETVSWIIRNLSSYLVFGIIVLLQPELRRAIGEIGNMPIFKWLTPKDSSNLENIVEAVIEMANHKIGSIICILKTIKPQGILDKSVKLDANISRELLLSIFQKESPLHDGAVIIEKNKILAASCFLPISQSELLKTIHGARHRAAMGMAEETDAVIIVTSETNGYISIMYNGQMFSPIEEKNLKNKILELLQS